MIRTFKTLRRVHEQTKRPVPPFPCHARPASWPALKKKMKSVFRTGSRFSLSNTIVPLLQSHCRCRTGFMYATGSVISYQVSYYSYYLLGPLEHVPYLWTGVARGTLVRIHILTPQHSRRHNPSSLTAGLGNFTHYRASMFIIVAFRSRFNLLFYERRRRGMSGPVILNGRSTPTESCRYGRQYM